MKKKVNNIHEEKKDHWIYKHPEALDSLIRGLEDIKEGKVSKLDLDFLETAERLGEVLE